MAAARGYPRPPELVLLTLPGLVAASEPAASRSDRAVGVLLGVLLCLAVGLALAWHHLCRLSAGRYHPRPLGRRALAVLRGHWSRLQGRGGLGARDGDGEQDVAGAPRDEEEELMPPPQDQHRADEVAGQEEEKEEEEEEEEVTATLDTEADGAQGAEPADLDGSPPPAGQAAGGSAEALLSDLHAFSGTAAWGDTRPHVTVL
ncbi:protein tyrosine phosphatase receptor type C-associated protein isoform X2 [Struthio camelus]|uniref:protein tyrosine phosphatase receptor type C-associated protein isoform X2 n=1 Tax=Struthio camelus TaxID=8801 RepID=UPI0036042E56